MKIKKIVFRAYAIHNSQGRMETKRLMFAKHAKIEGGSTIIGSRVRRGEGRHGSL